MTPISHLKTRLSLLSGAFLMLLLGGAIYMFYRPHVLLMHVWVDNIFMAPWIDNVRQMTGMVRLPSYIVYCLPGALWSTAYILVSDALFLHLPLAKRLSWAVVVPVLGTVSEIMQAFHILPGHFDWLDLLCYILPFLLYSILITKR